MKERQALKRRSHMGPFDESDVRGAATSSVVLAPSPVRTAAWLPLTPRFSAATKLDGLANVVSGWKGDLAPTDLAYLFDVIIPEAFTRIIAAGEGLRLDEAEDLLADGSHQTDGEKRKYIDILTKRARLEREARARASSSDSE